MTDSTQQPPIEELLEHYGRLSPDESLTDGLDETYVMGLVTKVQQELNMNDASITVDGVFGDATQAALANHILTNGTDTLKPEARMGASKLTIDADNKDLIEMREGCELQLSGLSITCPETRNVSANSR